MIGECNDLSKDDMVVACIDLAKKLTFKMSRTPIEHWGSPGPAGMFDCGELLLTTSGESVR
ncbi:hypothetical protein D3C76_1805250 [compost metagenome]